MCGRYTLRRSDFAFAIYRAMNRPHPEEFSETNLVPRFNIAPSQGVPIIRNNHNGDPVISLVAWGLIPHWTKGTPKTKPINARDDKVLVSPMFKGAMERRRCLVPADGFYEWQDTEPAKVPWFFHLPDDAPFAFAGLWERWKPDPDAEPIDTCLHITTTPNALISPIHDRMPAILHRDDYARWLDRDVPPAEAAKLLRPYPAEQMESQMVSTRVNSTKNQGPELLDRDD
jgi:putative SOS response-associated peptidase YedK